MPNPKVGSILVTVNVPRDTDNPGFSNLPRTITIEEDRPTGASVFDCIGTDGDRRVSYKNY